MSKKRVVRVLSTALSLMMLGGSVVSLGSCGKKKDSIIVMTEELSGLFNPFYATSGADMDVVGMTQIGMLSTDREGNTVAGDDLPTVVKAFDQKTEGTGDAAKTVYTFVLKNNLTFSDGHPLTMEDVLFNMYEYLDPVYTGSSTMYSIDIEGLSKYRTQQDRSGDGNDEASEQIASEAAANARLRLLELVNIFEEKGLIDGTQNSYSLNEAQMVAAINEWSVTDGYKTAVASAAELKTFTDEDYRKILLADYELTKKTFKEELESDFKAAKESFDLETMPYSEHKEKLQNDIFKFFLYEGRITPVYNKINGKTDRTKILSFDGEALVNNITTQEDAINKIYNDTIKSELNNVLTQWGTSGTLMTLYTADAIDIAMRNIMEKNGGQLAYPNISGIVSLGHTTSVETVTVKGVNYNVASYNDLDENGVPKNNNEYEVLQITVNGTDPKAIFNFSFTVAPAHYYTADAENPEGREIDIRNNKFGVEFASSDFQSNVIQSQEHLEIPMGAGPFKATNKDNADNPKGSEFWSENLVYFKANDNFMFDVKADKLRYQVVSSTNALDKLENGEVDYITPQFTKANAERLRGMTDNGFTMLDSWQLGYGYIGINAGKVPNINVRRAIMSAMQTSLALEYYESGTCKIIDWPMSTVSWAYPFEADKVTSKPNGHDYTQWTDTSATNYANAKAEIQKYMNAAGVQAGHSDLTIKFTIAGASITEHPTYAVFKQAAELLNEMGWNVEVKADSQALTKLSTGSLEVWAAAWGSTIDPDMYQVYHKNSSATSVYAWGYREIKANPSLYKEETSLINALSKKIDEGRSITDKAKRTAIYEEAMGYVLDLAVELPVYQRKTLYAYNNETIQGLTDEVNPYTSPLEKIWEVELTDAAKSGAAGAESNGSVVVIVIVSVLGAAAVAVGGFFGYKAIMKKKNAAMYSLEEEEEESEETEAEEVSDETEVSEETEAEEVSDETEKDSD